MRSEAGRHSEAYPEHGPRRLVDAEPIALIICPFGPSVSGTLPRGTQRQNPIIPLLSPDFLLINSMPASAPPDSSKSVGHLRHYALEPPLPLEFFGGMKGARDCLRKLAVLRGKGPKPPERIAREAAGPWRGLLEGE
jgi:hypothetical protein